MIVARKLIKRGLFGSTAVLLNMLGLSSVALAQQQTGFYDGPHMWGGGWWMFFGPLMMFLFIAALVVVVVLAARWLGGPSHGRALYPHPGKTPLDILKERFARGEIDKIEFEERRLALGE